MAETPDIEGADPGDVAEAAHAGEQLQRLRVAAGMTVEEVAERAEVDVEWLRRLEAGEGTHDVLYSQWTALVRATQPPRPEWWDDGYEHDLGLPPDGHREPTTDSGRRYWARVAAVAAEIEEHYGRGRTG
ncbi:MAG: helix-turn-helix domain-containing protein [Actinomycetota bacterium]|nr:helix-turn-helix domain-containing protein [Actinomycetota bacterium]